MKTVGALIGVGLLQVATLASGALYEFNTNLMATRSSKANRFTFSSEQENPLLHNVAILEGEDNIPCVLSTGEKEVSGSVTVLIAISKCLEQSSIDMIEDWISRVKTDKISHFQDAGQTVQVNYETTLVPGACQARTEREKKGLHEPNEPVVVPNEPVEPEEQEEQGEPAAFLMSDDVLPGEEQRIAAFAKFGRILTVLPQDPGTVTDIPIAVVSFVNNDKSFDLVDQYEKELKISNTFNFRFCGEGVSCNGFFENCIDLQENVDLFMYSPYTITRSFECNSVLNGGLPVTYVDAAGQRQCYCSCPVGYKKQGEEGNYQCEPVTTDTCPCVWSTHSYGYTIENTEELETCVFNNIASRWGVPVPFPSDNYVADSRTNDHDTPPSNLGEGPRIELTTHERSQPLYDFETIARRSYRHDNQYSVDALPPFLEDLQSLFTEGTSDHLQELEDSSELSFTPVNAKFTWRDYQVNRQAKIDDLQFTSYGLYTLEIDAYDYSNTAQCTGCLAIVDKYRPQATTTCPVGFCDDTTSICHDYNQHTAELTPSNVVLAQQFVTENHNFADLAKNDACSVHSRCDEKVFGIKDFFDEKYCFDKPYADSSKCFDTDDLAIKFYQHRKAKRNPLRARIGHSNNYRTKQDGEVPVVEGQCQRCCSFSTALKEYWNDYKCGYEYDTRHCSGLDTEKCSGDQCLVLFGDTLAKVTVDLKDEVKEESQKVLDNIVQEGYQTYTQIHRGLQCTNFVDPANPPEGGPDGACQYEAKIHDLIQTHAESTYGTPSNVDINDYVFWRYRVSTTGDNDWHLFDPRGTGANDPVHIFSVAETKITVEAWTQCGIVRKFYFYVHLHLNSDVTVCEIFDDMFYQSSVSLLKLSDTSSFCAYPGSDFAELTFDYHPNAGLVYSRDRQRMNIASVVCSINYDQHLPAELLNIQATSPEIVRRFAIELLNHDSTIAKTSFDISCDFEYIRADHTQVFKTCSRSFHIEDCKGPEIDQPHEECKFDDCAGSDRPGPYEACGGTIVKATHDRTYVVEKEDETCCIACGSTSTLCVPLLGLPDHDIKRCEPQFPPKDEYAYGNPYGQYNDESSDHYVFGETQVKLMMASTRQALANHAAATALFGATALIAIVALVVVRRRRAQQKIDMIDDVYYPLLN